MTVNFDLNFFLGVFFLIVLIVIGFILGTKNNSLIFIQVKMLLEDINKHKNKIKRTDSGLKVDISNEDKAQILFYVLKILYDSMLLKLSNEKNYKKIRQNDKNYLLEKIILKTDPELDGAENLNNWKYEILFNHFIDNGNFKRINNRKTQLNIVFGDKIFKEQDLVFELIYVPEQTVNLEYDKEEKKLLEDNKYKKQILIDNVIGKFLTKEQEDFLNLLMESLKEVKTPLSFDAPQNIAINELKNIIRK